MAEFNAALCLDTRAKKVSYIVIKNEINIDKLKINLQGTSRELFVAVLAVGAAARAGVPQVVLHQHARYHRAALRSAQHRVVLACV